MYGRFEFQPEKALEAILYIARGLKPADFHSVSKTLYFADLWHLEHFGRLITGDGYVAMKHGPVPSGAYDIMKAARGGQPESRFAALVQNAFAVNNAYRIVPLRSADTRLLSQSDIEALDHAIQRCDGMNFRQRTEATHDAAWQSADENEFISLDAIVDMLPNKEEVKEFLAVPVPD